MHPYCLLPKQNLCNDAQEALPRQEALPHQFLLPKQNVCNNVQEALPHQCLAPNKIM